MTTTRYWNAALAFFAVLSLLAVGVQHTAACHGSGMYGTEHNNTECEGDSCCPNSSNPIELHTGYKIESAEDIIVELTGRDFTLTRQYTSNWRADNPGMSGVQWFFNLFSYIELFPNTNAENTVNVISSAQGFRRFQHTESGTDRLYPGGAGVQYMDELVNDDDANHFTLDDYWVPRETNCTELQDGVRFRRLHTQGVGIDYYYAIEGGVLGEKIELREDNDCSASSPPTALVAGLLAFKEDIYGNRQYFEYLLDYPFDRNTPGPRVKAVWCFRADQNPVTDLPEAKIEFEWIGGNDPETEGQADDFIPPADSGRLRRAIVKRPMSGALTEVQRVVYHYLNDVFEYYDPDEDNNSDVHPHIGIDGDLVQVLNYTRVDKQVVPGAGTASKAYEPITGVDNADPADDYGLVDYPSHVAITQYRYYEDNYTVSLDETPMSDDPVLDTYDPRLQAPFSVDVDGDPVIGGYTRTSYVPGENHKLKMILKPQQIEFAAQQENEGKMNPDTLQDVALLMMKLPDEETVTGGMNDYIGGREIAAYASKWILEYGLSNDGESMNAVLRQFVQTDSCGCSGTGAFGKKLDYVYLDHSAPSTSEKEYSYTTVIIETRLDDSEYVDPEYLLHRVQRYDLGFPAEETDSPKYHQPNYVINDVISTYNSSGSHVADYVSHHVYDTSTGDFARRNQKIRTFTPAVTSSYTPAGKNGSTITEPSYSPNTSQGLVYAYEYDNDNRLIRSYVREGSGSITDTDFDPGETDLAEASEFSLVEETVYGDESSTVSSTNPWRHLPKEIIKYRYDDDRGTGSGTFGADAIEVVKFEYGFYDAETTSSGFNFGDFGIAWVKTIVEAETVAESGPGGTYSSYELFDEVGNNVWSIDATGMYTKRTYDGVVGTVSQTIYNAAWPAATWAAEQNLTLPADRSGAANGGSFTIERDHDVLGRITREKGPGGVETLYRYEVVDGEDYDRAEGVYYAQIELPHILAAGEFNGPAVLRVFDAEMNHIGESEYEVSQSGTAYPDFDDPLEDRATDVSVIGDETARWSLEQSVSGLASGLKRWHNLGDATNGFYTSKTIHDSLGRVAFEISPTLDSVAYVYDDLDRLIETYKGAVQSSTTLTMSALTTDIDTPDSSYFLIVEERSYDHQEDMTGNVGNGILTQIVQTTATGDTRTTEFEYDYRDRPIIIENPEPPYLAYVYDNLDRPTDVGYFSSVPTSITSSSRERFEHTDYSQRGSIVARRRSLDPDPTALSEILPLYASSGNPLEGVVGEFYWFDGVGRVISEEQLGGQHLKLELDAHGRIVKESTSDGDGDARPGASGSHADASSVSDDHVIEQTRYEYYKNTTEGAFADHSGQIELIANTMRAHDAGSFTGDDDQATGYSDAHVTTYVGFDYDDADRMTKQIEFGTGDTTNDDLRQASSPSNDPSSPPTHAQTTTYAYNDDGLRDTITDAEGVTLKYFFDDLDRIGVAVENYDSGVTNYTDPAMDPTASINGSDGKQNWTIDRGDSNPDENRTTVFVYNGDDNIVRQIAFNLDESGGTENKQATEYEYSVGTVHQTNAPASRALSNSWVTAVIYPDEFGETMPKKEEYYYNRLGEVIYFVDQNGTRHNYTRDGLGRITEDDAAVLGADIYSHSTDNGEDLLAARTLMYTYDSATGMLATAKTLDGQTTPTVINAQQYAYDDFWMLKSVLENPIGDVSGDDARTAEYEYVSSDARTDNHYRLDELHYPDPDPASPHAGRTVLAYDYGAADSIDDLISRANGFSWGSPSRDVAYEWLGMAAVATKAYGSTTTPSVRLDRQIDSDQSPPYSSGVYSGYDRFGRVARQLWIDDDSSWDPDDHPPIADYVYTYNKVDNVLSRDYDAKKNTATLPLPAQGLDSLYQHDGLHRLVNDDRGRISGSSITFEGTLGTQWLLEALGNWHEKTVNSDGDSDYDSSDDVFDGEFNLANEYSSRTKAALTTNYTYDEAGNLTDIDYPAMDQDPDRELVYDAWNRLVVVEDDGEARAMFGYFAGHQRAIRVGQKYEKGFINNGMRLYYYDGQWRLLEERDYTDHDFATEDPYDTATWPSGKAFRRIWGITYIDEFCALLTTFDDTPTTSPFVPDDYYDSDDTLWPVCDRNHDVIALLDDDALVLERTRYSAYGEPVTALAGDFDHDGTVTNGPSNSDKSAIVSAAALQPNTITQSGDYWPEMDFDRDGDVDSTDVATFDAIFLAQPVNDIDAGNLSVYDNTVGYAGYLHDDVLEFALARYRWDDVSEGKWITRDPIEAVHVADMNMPYTQIIAARHVDLRSGYDRVVMSTIIKERENMYQYVMSNPIRLSDYSGLASSCGGGGCWSRCMTQHVSNGPAKALIAAAIASCGPAFPIPKRLLPRGMRKKFAGGSRFTGPLSITQHGANKIKKNFGRNIFRRAGRFLARRACPAVGIPAAAYLAGGAASCGVLCAQDSTSF